MPYKNTLPSTMEARERAKQIAELLKKQRKFPRLSLIDMVDIMTTEYLEVLKGKAKNL